MTPATCISLNTCQRNVGIIYGTSNKYLARACVNKFTCLLLCTCMGLGTYESLLVQKCFAIVDTLPRKLVTIINIATSIKLCSINMFGHAWDMQKTIAVCTCHRSETLGRMRYKAIM